MELFIKPKTMANDYECKVTMSLQKDPYFYRELRICHTPTSLLLSGTYHEFYMVIEFPLRAACPEHYECPCLENEVEIAEASSHFTKMVSVWTHYYKEFMHDSQLKIEVGDKLINIRIPYLFGKYIQDHSRGSFYGNGIIFH
jgi:hypothetical protein